jgi:hypothetical protein
LAKERKKGKEEAHSSLERFERREGEEELLGAFLEEERAHEVKGLGEAIAWYYSTMESRPWIMGYILCEGAFI